MLLSVCFVELAAIFILCIINGEVSQEKEYWKNKHDTLKNRIKNLGA